jgi:hypothetical protein
MYQAFITLGDKSWTYTGSLKALEKALDDELSGFLGYRANKVEIRENGKKVLSSFSLDELYEDLQALKADKHARFERLMDLCIPLAQVADMSDGVREGMSVHVNVSRLREVRDFLTEEGRITDSRFGEFQTSGDTQLTEVPVDLSDPDVGKTED